ncbi:hypothetical protein BAY61_14825 [Prauserella marina]|uniref:Peptide/nickel transport system permease protein n=1 Tax=Prauserella marina TaxID=530584 RepID=A0A222VQ72_9PSEU|nr:ABC transporter permease [Prauserella marina]ASR36065.1 hypothetical protein BAY61_14825 [Prauserella marina]PWV76792.1 peptide/nickel transport system permease protein [Prauserella marina]SDC97720.1 peptide/nickel transport system permease protein [Prauserella marina]
MKRRSFSLFAGGLLLVLFLGSGLLSLFWTPFAADTIDIPHRLAPPGTDGHLLGTDALGRDVVSQLMAGARNSMLVAVVSTVLATVPGVLAGLVIAGAGRTARTVMSRLVDLGVALPGILIALVLATTLGAGNSAAIIAIVISFIPIVIRVTMAPARQVLALDYVEAARAYGRGRYFVLFRHVLPGITPVLIVLSSVLFASAILTEAALSYLGAGAQRPVPSWGRMLNEAQATIDIAPQLVVFPGLAIVVAVLGFNLFGDGVRAVLDPRQARTVVS